MLLKDFNQDLFQKMKKHNTCAYCVDIILQTFKYDFSMAMYKNIKRESEESKSNHFTFLDE